MNVGFVGLGKLGLPSALAIESKGHAVPRGGRARDLEEREAGGPAAGRGAAPLRDCVRIRADAPRPALRGDDEAARHDGGFDCTYLKDACRVVSEELDRIGEDRIVVIISTVLPGTIEREIKPLLSRHAKLCYNPFFIAMGTTVHDFLNPEIVLFGVDDPEAVAKAKEFYSTMADVPFHEMSIVNAELVKVNYNTFITTKINFANNLMEVCQKMRERAPTLTSTSQSTPLPTASAALSARRT